MAKLLLVLVSYMCVYRTNMYIYMYISPSRGVSKSRRNFSVFVVKSDIDVSIFLRHAGQARRHALFLLFYTTERACIVAKSSDSVELFISTKCMHRSCKKMSKLVTSVTNAQQ